MTMYIQTYVNNNVTAARQAFGTQVLGYTLGHTDVPESDG